MEGNLDVLLADGVIDELLGRLKSGKEADVWLVRHGEEVHAAKVYKARNDRNFKNNAGYKEGRAVRNTRTQRAIDRGSRFGQQAAEDAWKSAEADALYKLHAQGVRVPAPVIFYEGVLIMRLVLGADGHPAPRLIDSQLTPAEAAATYADLRIQAIKMLCCDLIHGDLSPYNVLRSADGPVIIDFPQVVAAAHNSQAEFFFRRDIENLRLHFAGIAPELASHSGDAQEIWRAYVRRELTPEFVPSGRPPPPERPARPARPEQHPRAHGQERPQRPPHAAARPQKQAPARPQQQGNHARPQPSSQAPRHGQSPRPAHPEQTRPAPPHQQARPAQPRPQHPRPQHPGARHPKPQQPGPQQAKPQQGAAQHPRPHQPGPQHGTASARPPHSGARPTRPSGRPPQHGRPPAQAQRRPPPRPPHPEVVRVTRPPLAAPRLEERPPHDEDPLRKR